MSGQPPYLPTGQYSYPRDVRYGPNATVEFSRRPSMLANHQTSMPPYYLPIPAVSMGAHVDETAKRAHYAGLNAQFLPLGIDVKKERALYQPATEAISPINDEIKFDTHLRDTSTIRNTISKLESEIGMTQEKLHRAKLNQREIRRQADRTAVDDDEEIENTIQINGSQTLIEKILHENRKTAEDGQKVLNQLNNYLELTVPLYQEPNDLESIGEIRRKYMNIMKNRLVHLFKKSRERYMLRTKFACEKYDQSYRNWQKSIEKEEKSIISKDASTYRETFEKTFPELRKAREDKEKKQSNEINVENSTPTPTPSMLNSTTNSIEHDNEEDDEKMRKLSVVPPILYDTWQRKHQYFNQNGLIKDDVTQFYKDHAKLPYWSAEEKQIFIEKFTQSPKNFGYIAFFLPNKTTDECVQFYYMTKKTENYKNLLRKQNQPIRRRARQNQPTTMTTTTVTSSTTIETTLVTKVTSSNTIVSSTSQQILGSTNGQENDRVENDDDRRDLGDNNEEKRANKSRCQFLSCTTGRKKTRKNRLRGFPRQWNELTDEHREEIRRTLKIPANIQRCCKCCYEKLIPEIRQRQDNQVEEDDDEDDDDDENNDDLNVSNRSNSKRDDDEWTAADIDAFTQAVDKFNYNWREIAEYLQRSEKSCRTFYQNQQKAIVADDNVDDDNRSLSDSEISPRKTLQIDETVKQNLNDDSNDSPHLMIIDEGEETRSMIEENSVKSTRITSNPSGSNLTTINSLVEKEICKTLHQTEKRLNNNSSISSTEKSEQISPPVPPPPTTIPTNLNPSASRNIPTPQSTPTTIPPPPLAIPIRPHSPSTSHHPYSSYSQGTPTSAATKGSIMRGTPISTSVGMNKTMALEAASTLHPHAYHTSSRNESNPMKSPKILDRNLEQQQQQQQHHNAYYRQYPQSGLSPYLSQQQQQQQQQSGSHKSSLNKHDPSNSNTYETLRADFYTSKYLAQPTASHPSSHERSHRSGAPPSSEHRMSRQASPPPINPALLPPPAAIVPSTSNPSVQSSGHPQHAQAASNFLSPSQILAAPSNMYAQEFLTSGLLPYAPYYGSLPPGAQYLIDPRTMRDFGVVAANNEQMKFEQQKSAMRVNRHHQHHPSAHSPPDPSSVYPSAHQAKRHFADEMGYPNAEYGSSAWRAPTGNHSAFTKTNPGTNENPLSKLNEMSRQSSSRMTSGNERNSRSPDEHLHQHHRMNHNRSAVESPSLHFQRVEAQNHPKMSQDPNNAPLHYLDHPNDGSSHGYMRASMHIPKPQPTHPSPHRPHPSNNPSGRPIIPSSPHQTPHHPSNYPMHGFPHPSMGTISPQRQHQQQSSPHHPPSHGLSHSSASSHHPSAQHYANQHRGASSASNQKESIQSYMVKVADEFVRMNHNLKHSALDHSSYESTVNPLSSRHHQASNSDQPILIDGNDDTSPHEQNETDLNMRTAHKSHGEGEMPGRRRDSSIKKILANQSLEKQEYDEINQKVQNNPNNSSKLSSNNDPSGMERSNSIGGRTRSRGSITMRMLMGENEPYVDGKAQRRPSQDEPSNKRPLSPSINNEKIGYLIRDALYRTHPTLPKDNDAPSVFQKSSAAHQQPTPSKRMRTSTRDDDPRQTSNRSPVDSNANSRDPFALQPHSKSAHSSSFAPSSNADRAWQTHAQQQFHHSSSSPAFQNRSSAGRPPNSIPSSMRLPNEQGTYGLATNNQLINPRYPYYMNKNETQFQLGRQTSTSPHDSSVSTKLPRRSYHTGSPTNDSQPSATIPVNIDQSPNAKSPSVNPMMTNPMVGNTPPTTASPTMNTGHSLKKRLITEYSLEQQRNSPVAPSATVAAPPSSSTPSPSTKSDGPEETNETHSTNDTTENITSKTDIPPETVHESTDDPEHST